MSEPEALPEGSVETGRVLIRAYLDKDGRNSYALTTRGDNPASTFLGLLLFAQRDILAWSGEEEA